MTSVISKIQFFQQFSSFPLFSHSIPLLFLKKPLTVTELCKVSGLKDYPLVVTEQKRVDWSEYEAFEFYYLPQLTTNSCKVDADLFMLKTLCKAKWNELVKQ